MTVKTQQALRNFSETAKGLYWQTYKIVDCSIAYFTLVNMGVNFDSVSQPLHFNSCYIWINDLKGSWVILESYWVIL